MDDFRGRGGPPPPRPPGPGRRGGAPQWGQPGRPHPGRPYPPPPPAQGAGYPPTAAPRRPRPLQRTALLPAQRRRSPQGAVGAPPRRPARPRPVRRRPRWGRRLGIALLALVVLVAGFALYVDGSLARVPALPSDSAASSEGTNWLIVGSDSRANLTAEQRKEYATGDPESELTDTIMLLHTGSGPTTLVSIPRDSIVDIPGKGRHKINSAYGRGGGAEGGGPELLVSTVEKATGLRIDHYIEIGFLGIVSVVDAVGGVEMCVPESIKDPKAALDIKAGCQTLDEATALGYVRTRATASSDFGRVERQRAFISALLDKATSPATLFNPFRTIPLATGLSGSIAVDRSTHVWHLAQLGLAMRGLSDGISTTVPVRDGVVNWDKTRSKALFDALKADERPPDNALGP
ncbi:LCP family protein [Pseudonocardia adelaidensis]|uniref:LCP family protein n=1 Tax=Pseudonocardia adelaidensis TaxID=648754 RepID=UPI0031E9CB15